MEPIGRVLLGAIFGGTTTWVLGSLGLNSSGRGWRAFGTAAGFAAGALSFRPGHYDIGPAIASSLVASALVAIAVCDLKERRIPNRLTYPLVVGGLSAAWVWPDRPLSAIFVGAIAATAVMAALAALSWALSRTGDHDAPFGLGDMKLVVVLGTALGWPLFLWALFLGATLGGVAAAVMLVSGHRALAYGPYLAAGGLVALLWPVASPWIGGRRNTASTKAPELSDVWAVPVDSE